MNLKHYLCRMTRQYTQIKTLISFNVSYYIYLKDTVVAMGEITFKETKREKEEVEFALKS